MNLPSRDSLHTPDHFFLYDHDTRELHNPDPTDFVHLMYLNRFEIVLETVERFAQGKVVLDVGCAQGNFSLALAERGYRVVAMDLRRSYLQYLLLKHEHGSVNRIAASVESFPFKPTTFDVILLGEILEHVAYPEQLIGLAASLLRPTGILVATTPNGERLHTGLPTLSAIVDREALTARQFQPDADGHLFLLTGAELRKLTREAGLTVVEHRHFATGWVTGRLTFRHVARFLPVAARRWLDRGTLRVPGVRRFISEGQIIVAKRTSDSSDIGPNSEAASKSVLVPEN